MYSSLWRRNNGNDETPNDGADEARNDGDDQGPNDGANEGLNDGDDEWIPESMWYGSTNDWWISVKLSDHVSPILVYLVDLKTIL